MIALVHNGIIENHDALRSQLQNQDYAFVSQTDTEVIAHLIDSLYEGLFAAVQNCAHVPVTAHTPCRDAPRRAAPHRGRAQARP